MVMALVYTVNKSIVYTPLLRCDLEHDFNVRCDQSRVAGTELSATEASATAMLVTRINNGPSGKGNIRERQIGVQTIQCRF